MRAHARLLAATAAPPLTVELLRPCISFCYRIMHLINVGCHYPLPLLQTAPFFLMPNILAFVFCHIPTSLTLNENVEKLVDRAKCSNRRCTTCILDI